MQEKKMFLAPFMPIQDQLDSVENIVNEAWRAWFASDPYGAMHALKKVLPYLNYLFSSSFLSLEKLRIKELAVRCHGLLGTIYLDILLNDAAYYHYFRAYELANEIHDTNQSVTYLALTGDVLRRQGNKQWAISYIESARDMTTHVARATLSHTRQLLAYIYADTGQKTKFEHAIHEATDLLAFSSEGKDMTRRERFPFEIYEIRGKAYRELGQPFKSLEFLAVAETSRKVQIMTPRWHAAIDISKGQAYCDLGCITMGIELASQGFMLAYQFNSPRQMNRVRKLVTKLEMSRWESNPRVTELRKLVDKIYLSMNSGNYESQERTHEGSKELFECLYG